MGGNCTAIWKSAIPGVRGEDSHWLKRKEKMLNLGLVTDMLEREFDNRKV